MHVGTVKDAHWKDGNLHMTVVGSGRLDVESLLYRVMEGEKYMATITKDTGHTQATSGKSKYTISAVRIVFEPIVED